MTSTDLDKLVTAKIHGRSKCYGHCQDQYALKFLPFQKGMIIGSYVCPSGYVSRIVLYGNELNLHAFRKFLSSLLRGIVEVTDEDIRVATRYTWDLGITNEPPGRVLREAYWTQRYRRTKTDDPHRTTLFQCTKCGSFYCQPFSDKNTFCPQCGKAIS
ncbi:MAG TPA: hypothetical protein VK503_00225 [Candidatus Bathyarchaeia archaeon]|nr:hypothetical protein [Candidatus Bathyarchaeia archaeon]